MTAGELKKPWFPIPSKLWINVKKNLSPRDIVALVNLLEYSWSDPNCSIPSDPSEFVSIIPEPPDDIRAVLEFFIDHPKLGGRLVNPYLFAEFHSVPTKKQATKKTTSAPTVQAPLWKNCKHFRMTEEEFGLIKQIYKKRGYPAEWINIAISEVETWLSGETATAVKSRAQQTHYRRLFSAWVVENVTRSMKRQTPQQVIKKPNYFKAAPPVTENKAPLQKISDILANIGVRTHDRQNEGK